jgi:hypothetical protein
MFALACVMSEVRFGSALGFSSNAIAFVAYADEHFNAADMASRHVEGLN